MDATEGKVITCKAAVVYKLNSPFVVDQIQVLPPTPGHVRVKMVATALCHSDLAILSGYKTNVKMPYVPGHEGGGIVESVGEGVTSVKKGDKVFTLYFPHCGECRLCRANKSNICLDAKRKIQPLAPFMRAEGLDGLTSFTNLAGEVVYFGYGAASFSEYTVIPENSCVKIHPDTNLYNGCIMACGFLTGYGASTNVVDIISGDSVAIWGLGGVGLACLVGCKEKGASKIIGIDVNSEKETYAKKFGCTDFIAISNLEKGVTIQSKIIQMTEVGLDYAFVCIGSSQALEDAISCLAPGGTVVMIGVSKHSATITFENKLLLPSRTIKGTNYGDYSIFEDVPKLVERYVEGKLPVDDFITNIFTLDRINDAVDLMKQGKGIRSVIHF